MGTSEQVAQWLGRNRNQIIGQLTEFTHTHALWELQQLIVKSTVESRLKSYCRHLTQFMQFIKFNMKIIMVHVHGEKARVYIGLDNVL